MDACAALLDRALRAMGPDVQRTQEAGTYRYRRGGRLFAIVKPFARRFDVAFLKLGRARSTRIISGKGRLPFLPYLVEVEAEGDVDTELRAWLRESYDLAGDSPAA